MGSLSNSRATTPVSEYDAAKVVTYNEALQVVDSLAAGKFDVTITTADVTLTGTPVAPQAQNKYFNVTGALTGNRSLIFPVNDDDPATGNPRVIYVKNATSGSFTLTVKVSGQTGVTVTQGYTGILLHNGTDFVKLIEVSSAAGASLNTGAWTAWVPTWVNLTVGNGTVTAAYVQIGKLVVARLSIVFGTTTSISGDPTFTLPVTRATYGGTSGITPIGNAQAFDVSGGVASVIQVINISTTTGAFRANNASATYLTAAALSSTVPFTWTNPDELCAELFYEAA